MSIVTGVKLFKIETPRQIGGFKAVAYGSIEIAGAVSINIDLRQKDDDNSWWLAWPSYKAADGNYKKQVWPVKNDDVDYQKEFEAAVVQEWKKMNDGAVQASAEEAARPTPKTKVPY